MSGRAFAFGAIVAVCGTADRTDDSMRGATCGPAATIATEPAVPTQGALFHLRVSGVTPGSQLTGSVAGEALHFSADSVPESLAAAPIDSPDSLTVVVRCGGSDSIVARIGTASGNYPIERLRVAPAFGRPPDPATAAR